MGFERSVSSDLVRVASHPPPWVTVSARIFPCGHPPFHNDTPPPFILVFSPIPQIRVNFSLFWVVIRLINPHVGVVGEELDGMVRVWVCQAMGSTLRRWQPFSLCCSCAEFVLFFGRFEGVGHRVVLGHILGPSRSFYCVSLKIGLLGLGFGPLM